MFNWFDTRIRNVHIRHTHTITIFTLWFHVTINHLWLGTKRKKRPYIWMERHIFYDLCDLKRFLCTRLIIIKQRWEFASTIVYFLREDLTVSLSFFHVSSKYLVLVLCLSRSILHEDNGNPLRRKHFVSQLSMSLHAEYWSSMQSGTGLIFEYVFTHQESINRSKSMNAQTHTDSHHKHLDGDESTTWHYC